MDCTCRKYARCLNCLTRGPLHVLEDDLKAEAPWCDPVTGAMDYLALWAKFHDEHPET